jgi:WD40 repeat protein
VRTIACCTLIVVVACGIANEPLARRELDAEGYVVALRWSPDSSTLAVFRRVVKEFGDHQRSSRDVVELWDPIQGRVKKELFHSNGADRPIRALSDIAFSPDGKQLACLLWRFTNQPMSVETEIQIWDLPSAQKVKTFDGPPATGLNYPFSSTLLKLAYSRDGKLLAACGKLVDHDLSQGSHIGGEVCVWDAHSYKLKWDDRTTHSDIVYDLKFGKDGRTLFTGGRDCLVREWNATSGKLERTLFGVSWDGMDTLDLSPDDRFMAAGGEGLEAGEAAYLWDMRTGMLVKRYTEFKSGTTTYAAFGPDDTLYAVGQDPNARFRWQVRAWDPRTGQSKGILGDHDGASAAIAPSPDGKTLAVGATDHIILFALK